MIYRTPCLLLHYEWKEIGLHTELPSLTDINAYDLPILMRFLNFNIKQNFYLSFITELKHFLHKLEVMERHLFGSVCFICLCF